MPGSTRHPPSARRAARHVRDDGTQRTWWEGSPGDRDRDRRTSRKGAPQGSPGAHRAEPAERLGNPSKINSTAKSSLPKS